MSTTHTTRRQFLHSTFAAITAASVAPLAHVAVGSPALALAAKSLRLGAPIFNPPADPEQLALAHRKLGLRAAYCPPVGIGEKEKMRDIELAFAKHDVIIAEVGRWKNLMATDPQERQENMEFVKEGLALADEIGAHCCVDIAGSYSTESWFGPHPENLSEKHFEESVEKCARSSML